MVNPEPPQELESHIYIFKENQPSESHIEKAIFIFLKKINPQKLFCFLINF